MAHLGACAQPPWALPALVWLAFFACAAGTAAAADARGGDGAAAAAAAVLWDGAAYPSAALQADRTPASRLLLEVTSPDAGREGAAFAGATAAAAEAVSAAVPVWAVALLGASIAAAALVQLWHCLPPHRGLLRRASELEQAAAAACEVPVPVTAAAAAGSADLEAAWAGEAHKQPSVLAPLKTRPAAAAGHEPLLPAELPGPGARPQLPDSPIAAGLPRPVSLGSHAPDSPAALSSPSSPGGAVAWAPVDIDASVRARDLSRQSWVPTTTLAGRRGAGKASAGRPHSPLLSPARGGRPAAQAWEAAEAWEEAGSPRAGSASGSPRDPTGSDWQAKSARLDRGGSEVAAADFRLLAAALPGPSSAASAAWGGSSPAARPASPAKRPGSPSKRPASAPGSPSKAASRGPAARKLTGAKSVGPQELELDGEEWEEAGAAALLPASPAPAAASLLTASLAAAAPGTAEASHSGGSRPSSPTALRSVRLLSASQLQADVQLGRLLGVGGAACVYEAQWEGRTVAVKLLHPSSADARLLAREVEVMAAVGRHPHVVCLLAACLEPPSLALVQELAPTSLHDLLHRERRRPQYGALLAAAEALAAALHHCHTLSPPLVHRDMSAKNVLVGADGRMRLADFGLSKRRRGEGLSPDHAGALGTAAYMAPEAMQSGPITEAADVWAWGVLVWEMLTGRQPWAELASPLQVLFVVGVERRRLPIPPGTPPPLARLLREAWRHSAALRPTSASLLRRVRQLRSAEQLALQKPSRQGGSLGASSSRSIGGSPRAARQQGKAASPKAGRSKLGGSGGAARVAAAAAFA